MTTTQERFTLRTSYDTWQNRYDEGFFAGGYAFVSGQTIFRVQPPDLGWVSAKKGIPFIPLGLFHTDDFREFDSTQYKRFELSLEVESTAEDSISIVASDIMAYVPPRDTLPPDGYTRTGGIGADGKKRTWRQFYFQIPFERTLSFTVELNNVTVNNKHIKIPQLEIKRDQYSVWYPVMIHTH